jgi:alkylation response protein AidB-like acyl-CoA dehydrogenase
MSTNFLRTEEQSLLASTVADVAKREFSSAHVREVMVSGTHSATGWKALAELGLLGLLIDEADGGAGAGPVEAGIVAEVLGTVVAPVPFIASAVLSTVAIREAGSAEQRVRLLGPLASGAMTATLLLGSKVQAALVNGAWVLNGSASKVAWAASADLLVVPTSTDEGDVHIFVLPTAMDGVNVLALDALDQTSPIADVSFENVSVADTDRLAGLDAEGSLDTALLTAAAVLSMEQLGGTAKLHAMGVEYAKSRFQFGRAIGSFQAVKHALADDLVAIEAGRTLSWHAVSAMADDPDVEGPIAVSMARSWCSEMGEKVAADILQVHGGIGFTWESDVHLYLKRARANRITLGTPKMWRARLSTIIDV